MGRFFTDKVRKRVVNFGLLDLFCIYTAKTAKKILLMGGKFSFLYVDIWFVLAKSKFIVKTRSFKMMVVLSPILWQT